MPSIKSRRRRKRHSYSLEELLVNIIAIAVLVLVFVYVRNGDFFVKNNKNPVALHKVAAFQMPFKTLMLIQELSEKYHIDFYELVTISALEEDFFYARPETPTIMSLEQNIILNYNELKKNYKKIYPPYKEFIQSIFEDIQYFPIPSGYDDESESSYMYGDSWGSERAYGDGHSHEGTDVLDRDNIRGRIPIVSMTEGVITTIGWNELGGFQIGITSSNQNYYYYAHLDHYAEGIKKGDRVAAGQFLGFMGDTGNSKKEGTTGKFPVHLHVGISPYTSFAGKDFWINPYVFLRFAENQKVPYNVETMK